MKDVIERLEARAEAWSLNGPSARVNIRLGDLRALLFYTKQCEEALRQIASCSSHHQGDVVDLARQALSLIQQGE